MPEANGSQAHTRNGKMTPSNRKPQMTIESHMTTHTCTHTHTDTRGPWHIFARSDPNQLRGCRAEAHALICGKLFPECNFERLMFTCMFVSGEHGVCAHSGIRLPCLPEEVVPRLVPRSDPNQLRGRRAEAHALRCGNLFPECDFESLMFMCMFVTREHRCALIQGSGCPVLQKRSSP